MEGIPAFVGDLSAAGILGTLIVFFVVAMVRGWLIPKIHYDMVVKSRDSWQKQAMEGQETIRQQSETIEKLTSVGVTIDKVMTSIQDLRDSAEGSR